MSRAESNIGRGLTQLPCSTRTAIASLGRKPQSCYECASKKKKKNLLIAELIVKFQTIFHCLQESCFVQASQYADYLATEPPHCCLKLNL